MRLYFLDGLFINSFNYKLWRLILIMHLQINLNHMMIIDNMYSIFGTILLIQVEVIVITFAIVTVVVLVVAELIVLQVSSFASL